MSTVEIPRTSRAAVITAFNEPLEIQEIPVPEDIQPRALLVRILGSSICGSDVHVWDGSLAASLPLSLPLIPGHEMVGEIVRIGPGANRDSVGSMLRVGDRVVFSHASCGRCHFCTISGQETLCRDRQWYMFDSPLEFPYLVGGFSEYCYVFANAGRVKVPDDVKTTWASAASCALRTVVRSFERLGQIEPWQTVLIQGAGPLGLFATAMANHLGAGQIIVVGGPDTRLELASEWGATDVVPVDGSSTPDQRVERVRTLTSGTGADVAMELSGASTAFEEGLGMLRDGARYVVTGQVGGQQMNLAPATITRHDWSILGSWSGDITHYWKALQFLSKTQSKYNFDRLISNTYHLDEINTAMDRMQRFEEIKPMVVPTLSGDS